MGVWVPLLIVLVLVLFHGVDPDPDHEHDRLVGCAFAAAHYNRSALRP